MSYRWLRAVLAASALGWGSVWAESPREEAERGWQAAIAASGTRIEVTPTQDFESGDWVLVQPGGGKASRPWELVRVEVVGQGRLELGRPLADLPQNTELRLVTVSQDPETSAVLGLDWPMPGAEVPGGTLPVAGRAPRGSQVLVFVDGVEGARLEVDTSGRFAGEVSSPLAAGNHLLQVVSGSEGLWRLGSESVTVVSLAPPPTPTVLEPGNNSYTNKTQPLFRGTGEAGTTVIVSIGGADVGSTTVDGAGNWSLTLTTSLQEGAYSASLRARSSSGETSGLVSRTFTVDLTPPRVNYNGGPGPLTSATFASIYFSATEPSRFECSFEGSDFQSCSSSYDVANLADGPHVFMARATDRAGNVSSSPLRVSWVVDTVAPTVQITKAPRTWTNETFADFSLQASEEVSYYECSLDGTARSHPDCNGAVVLLNLSEGHHVLKVHAVDLAGGAGPEVTYEWNTDYTPPPVPVLLQPVKGSLLNSPTPDISGSAEPGAQVKVIIGGIERCSASVAPSGSWTCKPTASLTTNPSYELALEVWDAAGNVNNQFTPSSFELDVDLPDTFIDLPGTFTRALRGSVSRIASPVFGFRSNEQGVTFECSVGEEAFGSCAELSNGSRSFAPGAYSLRVRSRDRAGNVDETPASEMWVYSLDEGSGGGLLGCSASGATPLLPLVPLLALLKRRRSRASPRGVAGPGGLLALLMVFLAGPARAQGFDLQQYKPAPGSEDVLGVYSPQVAPGLGLHAGLSVGYAQNPLILRKVSDGQFVQSIVSSQITADVFASLSFLEHFELGLALPVTSQSGPTGGDLGVFIPENTTGTGLGDLRLVPKAVFPLGALSLGVAAVVSLPTANSQSFLGAGGVGVQPMVLAQWAASERFRVLANVGGRFQPTRQVPLLGMSVGNELSYALGANWSPGGFCSRCFVQGSLEGAMALNNARSNANPLELLAAVGYSLPGNVAVRLGGGPGLSSGYGTPNFRLFAGLSWGREDEKKVERIDVKPARVELSEAGQSVTLQPQAFTAKGEPVGSARFAFSSSDGQVATVDDAGKVTAVKSGPATLTTKSGAVSATTPVEISIPSKLELTGASVTLTGVGSETVLQVKVMDEAGRPVQGAKLKYESADPNVVAVEGNRLMAKGAGTTSVTITSGALKQTAGVTVVQPNVASVEVKIVPATLKVGETAQIAASAKASDGSTLQGVVFTFTTSDEKVATVDAAGKVTGVKVGSVTLKAEGWGKSSEKKLTIKKK